MQKNIILLLLISFYLLSIVISAQFTTPVGNHPNLSCGKNHPKKDTDCIKYGTDSGFCCCYVINGDGSKECKLLSMLVAENIDKLSDGESVKFGDDSTWECGNYSTYININIFLFTLLIFAM